MSFDAITSIAQAEDAAKVAVQYARAQAKQMLADADAASITYNNMYRSRCIIVKSSIRLALVGIMHIFIGSVLPKFSP